MDREQIIDLIESLGPVPANAVVDALMERDLLVLGPKRRWRVKVDDPGAFSAYEYEGIEAFSAWGASIEAARRAIRDDPGATFGQTQTTPEQRAHMADAADELVRAVAGWAVAVEVKDASLIFDTGKVV